MAGFAMPTHIKGLPELPKVRSYILPDQKGWIVGRRDFNQQELRMLAHFEDGALLQAYLENPRLDVHDFLMRRIIEDLGIDVDRGVTKTLNFGYIYGQGLGSLAERMDRTVEEVKQFRQAQMSVLPGLKGLSDSLKARARAGEPIRTWGGREYYVEPPRWNEDQNRWMTFEYKLLNYLVQGSSADVTKESIIRYHDVRKDGRFMLSVYDENDICAPAKAMKAEMLRLREAMMSIEVDVPLLSDGEIGPTLGDLEDLSEPAPDLSRWGL
jgi:DNA polymerase-1